MLITLTLGGTGRREGGSSPTDLRGVPQHVCGVALYSMWHFALGVDSRGSPTDSRGGPHHVCGVALCSVWGMDSKGGLYGFKR